MQVGDLILTGKSGYQGIVLGVDTETVTIHWFRLGEIHKQPAETVSTALQIGTWERYEGRRSINL